MTNPKLIPRDCTVFRSGPFTSIDLRYTNGSKLVATLDNGSGVFAVTGDWGDYACRFGLSTGSRLSDEIFTGMDPHYIANRLMPASAQTEVDLEATRRKLRDALTGVFQDDGNDEYTEEQFEDDLAYLDDFSCVEAINDHTFWLLEDHEVQDCFCERPTKAWSNLVNFAIPALQDAWQTLKHEGPDAVLGDLDVRIIRSALNCVLAPERHRLLIEPNASIAAANALRKLALIYDETTDKPL